MKVSAAAKQIPVFAIGLGLAIAGAAACDDGPNGPENTVVFTSSMTAGAETTPVTGAEANATGTATITFNLTRNASDAITAATADITATVNSMPAGSTLILAHIHTGAAGTAGSPVLNTGLTAATAVAIGSSGSATLTFTGLTLDPTVAQNIIDNPAGFYFNVHSAAHPGGVVRGQLVRR